MEFGNTGRDRLIEKVVETDGFDDVSEQEIICLWRSIKASGLSSEEAWHAVVTGIALDMAFAKTKTLKPVEH